MPFHTRKRPSPGKGRTEHTATRADSPHILSQNKEPAPHQPLMGSGGALALGDWAFLKQWKGPTGCAIASLASRVLGTCVTARTGSSLLVFRVSGNQSGGSGHQIDRPSPNHSAVQRFFDPMAAAAVPAAARTLIQERLLGTLPHFSSRVGPWLVILPWLRPWHFCPGRSRSHLSALPSPAHPWWGPLSCCL